jgi:tetratricopeptide (TPR) repeat protein
MATKCQNSIDYDKAVAFKKSGDLEGAAEIFTALGSFKDSVDLAKECKCSGDYDQAVQLMAKGDYAAAAKLLEYPSSVNYKDAKKLLLECTSSDTYDEAVVAFNAGKFYTAYELFNSIVGYKDAEDYADSCVQSKPSNTELYHNSSYSGTQNILNIKASYSGSTYLKLYSGSALVSTVFFNGKTTVTINVPNGTYKIKAALGDTWFGTEEMFGDEGTYTVLTFNGGADTVALTDGEYDLTLGGVSGGNVGSKSQSREGF